MANTFPVSPNKKGVRMNDIIMDAELQEYRARVLEESRVYGSVLNPPDSDRTYGEGKWFDNANLADSGVRPDGARVWMESDRL